MSKDDRRSGTTDEPTSKEGGAGSTTSSRRSWDSIWSDPSGAASSKTKASLGDTIDGLLANEASRRDDASGTSEAPPIKADPWGGEDDAQAPEPLAIREEPLLPPEEDISAEPPPTSEGEEEVSLFGTMLLGIGIFAAIVLGGIFFEMPVITREASAVSYSPADLLNGAVSDMFLDSANQEALNHYGIDVSVIFRPPDVEGSAIMQKLATECMPRRKYPAVTALNNAHETYALATEYLTCLMRRDQDRLCVPSERQRLVAQLMQYRDLRQHVFGIERARDEQVERIMKSPMAKWGMVATELQMELEGKKRSPAPPNPKIGKRVDQRIASSLAELNRNGYLCLEDFKWGVIFAPEEYAVFLDRRLAGTDAELCSADGRPATRTQASASRNAASSVTSPVGQNL